MKLSNFLFLNSLIAVALVLTSCTSNEPTYTYKTNSVPNTYSTGQSYGPLTRQVPYKVVSPDQYNQGNSYSAPRTATRSTYTPPANVTINRDRQAAPYDAFNQSYGRTDSRKLSRLYKSANVNSSILPYSSRSRTKRSMTPRYITIHSTQNRSRGADAWRHSAALRNGALGRIGWHYTTDEDRTVQHIPDKEQGNHAENYRGPGNKYSIGIEMCENVDNNIPKTIDRTAKLTAYLMHKHNIPLSNVKPHYHWPRTGYKVANKNCPHFLLDNGKPGRKWQNYLNLVDKYYRSATSGSKLAFNE